MKKCMLLDRCRAVEKAQEGTASRWSGERRGSSTRISTEGKFGEQIQFNAKASRQLSVKLRHSLLICQNGRRPFLMQAIDNG